MGIDLGIPDVEDAVEIGRGGFGVVYRARQSKLDREVAVKVLMQSSLDSAAQVRFGRECRAIGSLSGHPNVVMVYDSGFTTAGYPYLALEFLPDGSLGDRLRANGAFGFDAATRYVFKVAGALESSHRAGVLHRDVKPDNIMLDSYGEPKLSDFGIAWIDGATATKTSSMWGSPAYIAPEILDGKPASAASDIYSLASTLYALLSGHTAFAHDTDESIVQVLARITREPPPDLRPIGVPDPIWQVVARALEKDPARRPATAAEFANELGRAREQVGLAHLDLRVRTPPGGSIDPEAYPLPPSVTPAVPLAFDPATGSGPIPVPGATTPSGPIPPPASSPAGDPYQVTHQATASGPIGAHVSGPVSGTHTGSWSSPTGETGSGPIPPASKPRLSNAATAGIAAAVVVALVAVLAAVLTVTRSPNTAAPPAATTTIAPVPTTAPASTDGSTTEPSTEPTSTETPATDNGPANLSDALVPASEVADGWTIDETTAKDFTGFAFLQPCNESVDLSESSRQTETVLKGSDPTGKAVQSYQALAQFNDQAGAIAFMNSLPQHLTCKTWTDSTGENHDATPQALGVPDGDQSMLFHDMVSVGSTTYEHDLVFYRVGRYVGFITNLALDSTDPTFTDALLHVAVDHVKPYAQ